MTTPTTEQSADLPEGIPTLGNAEPRKSDRSTSRWPDARTRVPKLYAQGLSDLEIASRIGLVPGSVQRWRLRLGLRRPPNPGPPWSPKDDRQLSRLLRQGLTDAEIAVRLGRTAPTSIERRRQNLGLLRMVEHPWTDYEDELLRELWEQETTVREIAEALSRTPGAVTQRRRRLGLPPRT